VQESKYAIKFVRALLTNFLITESLIWKMDKSKMNILGIANCYYVDMVDTLENFGFWELDAREVFPLSTGEG
jgi:hypothetical protein